MTDTKTKEETKGDEVLRRMLKTPPKPHDDRTDVEKSNHLNDHKDRSPNQNS